MLVSSFKVGVHGLRVELYGYGHQAVAKFMASEFREVLCLSVVLVGWLARSWC